MIDSIIRAENHKSVRDLLYDTLRQFESLEMCITKISYSLTS